MVIDLVREDFWEIWSGDERLADGAEYAWDELAGPAYDQHDNLVLQAIVPLRSEDDVPRISELRVGQEWKLDGFSVEDDS